MPIQFPKKVINTTGVHHLDAHVQHVYVNIPTGTPAEATTLYLPQAEVVAAPIKIFSKGYGTSVYIKGHRGRTVSGVNQHQLSIYAGNNFLPEETRIELVPTVGDDGALTGNWSIVSGNVVNFAVISWNSLAVPSDTLTATGGSGTYDFSGLVTPVGSSIGNGIYVPAENGNYVFVADVSIASFAAGKIIEFSIETIDPFYLGVAFRSRQVGVSVDGEVLQKWKFVSAGYYKADIPIRFAVKHNDTEERNCAGSVAITRQM